MAGFSFGTSTPANSFKFGESAGTSTGLGFGGATTSGTTGSGFSFGQATPSGTGVTPSTSGGFSFGATSAGTKTPTTNGFGTSSSGFSFGGSTSSNPTTNGFGNLGATSSTAFGANTFGNNTNIGFGAGNTFGTNGFGNGQITNNFQNGASDGTMEDLKQIVDEYGITEPKTNQTVSLCLLKAIAFEIKPREIAQNIKRPAFFKEPQWKQATNQAIRLTEHLTSDNKESVIPTPVIGFKQLLDRIKMQDQHCGKLIHMLAQLQTKVQALTKKREQINQTINERLSNQLHLSQRLMHIMENVAVIQAGTHPLTNNEAHFRDRLEFLHQNLNSPTQFKAKLNEVMYLQRMQQKQPAIMVDDLTEDDAENVCAVLDKQREGLELLTKQVRQDRDDLDVMLNVHRGF